jgi:PAS domain S-box-containing protein
MDETLGSADLTRQIADAMPHIVWTHDRDGAVHYFNRAWVEYTGLDLEATVRVGPPTLVHPDDQPEIMRLFTESRRKGTALRATYRLRRRDGVYRWHDAEVVPITGLAPDGTTRALWVGTARDVDDERRFLDEHRFVAEATRVLGSSLDVRQTLGDVARLVVPHLADWCAIDLLGDDGRLERAGVGHVDPAKVELAWRLWREMPPKPEDPGGVYGVVRSGTPEHHREITDEMLVAALRDPETLALFRGLGLRSSMVVPLAGRDRILGALTFVSAESGRLYGARDLEFAQDFARRISVAIENARLYGDATAARAAAEAMAEDVIAQSRDAKAALLEMRARYEALRAECESLRAQLGTEQKPGR